VERGGVGCKYQTQERVKVRKKRARKKREGYKREGYKRERYKRERIQERRIQGRRIHGRKIKGKDEDFKSWTHQDVFCLHASGTIGQFVTVLW
jgi:hypothetical protein